MLLKVLLERIRKDVLKRSDLVSVESIIAWIRKQLVWEKSEDIIKKSHRPVDAITHRLDLPAPGADADIPQPINGTPWDAAAKTCQY